MSERIDDLESTLNKLVEESNQGQVANNIDNKQINEFNQ